MSRRHVCQRADCPSDASQVIELGVTLHCEVPSMRSSLCVSHQRARAQIVAIELAGQCAAVPRSSKLGKESTGLVTGEVKQEKRPVLPEPQTELRRVAVKVVDGRN